MTSSLPTKVGGFPEFLSHKTNVRLPARRGARETPEMAVCECNASEQEPIPSTLRTWRLRPCPSRNGCPATSGLFVRLANGSPSDMGHFNFKEVTAFLPRLNTVGILPTII